MSVGVSTSHRYASLSEPSHLSALKTLDFVVIGYSQACLIILEFTFFVACLVSAVLGQTAVHQLMSVMQCHYHETKVKTGIGFHQ